MWSHMLPAWCTPDGNHEQSSEIELLTNNQTRSKSATNSSLAAYPSPSPTTVSHFPPTACVTFEKSNSNNAVHSRVSIPKLLYHVMPYHDCRDCSHHQFTVSLSLCLWQVLIRACLCTGAWGLADILVFCSAKLLCTIYTRATNSISQLLRLVYESTWLSAGIALQEINSNPTK